ncbi:TonB-dependent siderophore receptor [Pseudoxanthomonas jiangsuensis]|uniref:TonB-dependent siderophore receptor n=1 Tax=Pseudoxanthomonas jiangsuensis TaxID=619688 RepID=UPI0031B5CC3D
MVFVAMAAAAHAAPQEARDEAGRGDARDPVTELDAVAVHGERQGLGLDTVAGQGALGARALIDTPFSVTVVDQEDIARRQAVTLGQIFINDPSVTTADAGGTTNWWGLKIRGLGVRSYYVDGVPMLMEWGGEFPVEAVESVQALKGLGGFMYGFGSPGGIISYQLKKPTDAPLLATTFGYRSDGVFSAHVDAGGRVAGAGSPGYRINAAAEHGEAYNGAQVDRELVSLALVQPLGERLTWRFDGFHEDSRLGGEPILFYWDLYQGRRPPAPTYDYRDVSVRNAFYKTQTAHATTGLEWRINEAWSVDFSLGHSRREHYSNKMFADLLNAEGDYSGSAYNFAGVLRNTFSRLLVQGRLQTGAIGHELALGADYQRATDQWGREWYWSNDFDGNLYRPQTFLVTRDFDFSLEPVSADTRQKALFASDTLHLGRHWQAVLGLRSTDFEMLDLDGDPGYDSGYDVRATTPTAAVIYKPSARTAHRGRLARVRRLPRQPPGRRLAPAGAGQRRIPCAGGAGPEPARQRALLRRCLVRRRQPRLQSVLRPGRGRLPVPHHPGRPPGPADRQRQQPVRPQVLAAGCAGRGPQRLAEPAHRLVTGRSPSSEFRTAFKTR